MTEKIYEIYCSGCPNENECHESQDYCEMVLEVIDD